jgi:hypothetical protein
MTQSCFIEEHLMRQDLRKELIDIRREAFNQRRVSRRLSRGHDSDRGGERRRWSLLLGVNLCVGVAM